jgi:hypothetical protein
LARHTHRGCVTLVPPLNVNTMPGGTVIESAVVGGLAWLAQRIAAESVSRIVDRAFDARPPTAWEKAPDASEVRRHDLSRGAFPTSDADVIVTDRGARIGRAPVILTFQTIADQSSGIPFPMVLGDVAHVRLRRGHHLVTALVLDLPARPDAIPVLLSVGWSTPWIASNKTETVTIPTSTATEKLVQELGLVGPHGEQLFELPSTVAQALPPTEWLHEAARPDAVHPGRGEAANPWSPTAHLQIGIDAWYAGRDDEAIRHLTVVLRQDPSSSAALNGRGQILADTGAAQAAVADLDLLLALQPDRTTAAYARSARALALAELGRVDEARNDMIEALAATPDNAWAYLRRARIELLQQENVKATYSLQLALKKRDPPLTDAQRALATRLLAENDTRA